MHMPTTQSNLVAQHFKGVVFSEVILWDVESSLVFTRNVQW